MICDLKFLGEMLCREHQMDIENYWSECCNLYKAHQRRVDQSEATFQTLLILKLNRNKYLDLWLTRWNFNLLSSDFIMLSYPFGNNRSCNIYSLCAMLLQSIDDYGSPLFPLFYDFQHYLLFFITSPCLCGNCFPIHLIKLVKLTEA